MAVMITVSELMALGKWQALCAMRGDLSGCTFDDEIEVDEGEAKKLGLV